ncbi:longevity assurance proteins LAG1 LAC1 [Cytidiella melzeri]|nr:longevity assurance proteins LAG1 LAC1 [Cytidiella melzeri]
MASSSVHKRRLRSGTVERIEADPDHHLAGPFRPQTPFETEFPPNSSVPYFAKTRSNGVAHVVPAGAWQNITSLQWIVVPASSLKMLLTVVVLWANWEILAPYVAKGLKNPFEPMLFLSHPIITSSSGEVRYHKGYLDLVFVAFHIIVWSFVRQAITLWICQPLGRWFGIKKEAKLDRFGEQGYAVAYFAFTGFWGLRIMSQLPTWFYRTEHFWIDYPHWDMPPELKRFYLMQSSYWCQQLLVMLLGLEKPRKDYNELVAHHVVTLWLIGWSYLINMTRIGNSVYVSMDIPDAFLAFSKLLNYIQWKRAKVISFVVFLCIWTYFRHYLNLVMLWSIWTEFDLIPETAKRWSPKDGVWLTWWMKYQIFTPVLLLQFLNLFWYYLVLRIAVRAVSGTEVDDDRSEDEGDDEPEADEKED